MRVLLDENINWRGSAICLDMKLNLFPCSGGRDLSVHAIAVIVLRSRSNRLDDTRPLMAAVLLAIPRAPKGERIVIE
jgi:hypothetical protein